MNLVSGKIVQSEDEV